MLAVIIEQEETDLLRPQNYKQQKEDHEKATQQNKI